MAYEQPGFSMTLLAGADLSSSQFCAVNVSNAGAAVLPAGAGGRAIGVLQNKPASGETATIVVDGITKGLVGVGGVTAGDTVQALADGSFTTAAAGDYAIGVALATGVAGVLVPILLTPSGGGGLIA